MSDLAIKCINICYQMRDELPKLMPQADNVKWHFKREII